MKYLLIKLRNPVIWLASTIVMLTFSQFLTEDRLDSVIRSDGRGYYAYLPALLIYNDASYQKSMEVEKRYSPFLSDQLYVYNDSDGKFYNKYFPGVALLQLPFFGMACLSSWLSGYPVDGYNSIFSFFFLVGGLFYGTTGIFLFYRFLKLMFPANTHLIEWIVLSAFMASTLIFYSTYTLGFSHLYSFFLFGLFSLNVLRLRKKQTLKEIFTLGSIVGLILLVRPTNGLVILMIPFILGDLKTTKSFIRELFVRRAKLFLGGLIGLIVILSIEFFICKWQSDKWVNWSYNGEGFNFLDPQFFAGFFSFRIGLFLHSPILMLSILGIVSMVREKSFQAMVWCIYFIINSWIILSWWCWDYESCFGPRPFTEHFFFLFIPLVYFVLNFPKWLVIISLGLVALNGGIRYYESRSGFLGDQRFSRANFLPSLKFWEQSNFNRWNFTRSTIPYGNVISTDILLNNQKITRIGPDAMYSFTAEKALEKPRTDERMYYRVKLDKKQNEEMFENVFLVIDAYTKDENSRYYKAIELFNDRLEGQKSWAHLEFEGQVYDNFQEYDFVKIYIWNSGQKTFLIKNIEVAFDIYKNGGESN
jgi:hypothetical protein